MTGRRAWPEGEGIAAYPPLPADFRLELDTSATRVGTHLITGGAPPVAARLDNAGAVALDALAAGATVGDAVARAGERASSFARWLVDVGLAHPRPPRVHRAEVTIVIPVHNRENAIGRLVEAVCGDGPTIVVDDGSTDDTSAVARRAGARVVRRARPGGPAAARNAGLAETTTELVAFVDSDCAPRAGWIDRLVPHFTDPAVALAAPRIVAAAPDSTVGHYEAGRSVLDQGPREARVDPFGPVTFVPSTALVVRRRALVEVDLFDESLHFGEDQDLVWRLGAAGWRLRYDPAAEVAHEHREEFGAFFRRRFAYGTPIATLGARHPDVVTAARVPGSVAAVAALATQRPRLGGVAALALMAAAAERVHRVGIPAAESARLAAGWELRALRTIAATVTGPWLPVAAVASVRSRRTAALVAALLVLRHGEDWRRTRSTVDPLRHLALRTADDAALAMGRWWGAARGRRLAAVAPSLLPMPAVSRAPLVDAAVVLR
jgi:mycofactocin system glycosyltransferase